MSRQSPPSWGVAGLPKYVPKVAALQHRARERPAGNRVPDARACASSPPAARRRRPGYASATFTGLQRAAALVGPFHIGKVCCSI
jgi:hypothetical protein